MGSVKDGHRMRVKSGNFSGEARLGQALEDRILVNLSLTKLCNATNPNTFITATLTATAAGTYDDIWKPIAVNIN